MPIENRRSTRSALPNRSAHRSRSASVIFAAGGCGMSSADTLLSIRDLSIRFGGVAALDRVSFDIAPGQIVGLIGPNGAGKTSLFNCISRLYQPSGGSMRFEQHELLVADLAPDVRRLAIVHDQGWFAVEPALAAVDLRLDRLEAQAPAVEQGAGTAIEFLAVPEDAGDLRVLAGAAVRRARSRPSSCARS